MAKNSLYLPARGTIRQKLRSAFVRRNHKDLLFVRLFQDKRELLQLYNALNGTHYENKHDILKDFLSKHRNEVTKVLLTEYDARKQRKMDIRDAREEGRIEGLAEGRTEGPQRGVFRDTMRDGSKFFN